MKKFIIFLKLHWPKLLVLFIFAAVFLAAGYFLYLGVTNYMGLESFSRKQISAYMGFFLIIGIFTAFIQLPLFFGMHYYFLQGGGLGSLGKDKISKAHVNVKWDEVIGMDSAKRDAWELVKLLKDRSMLKMIGGKIIKGTIMIGPPGCGKTYLAKAIATECGLPLLSAVGSEFVGMFVGQGAAQMKSLFKQAREMAKMHGGCIIFIDEIDSFARPRMQDTGWGGAISHNATINQFLTELDGLRQAENNIVVIAATNVGENELDSAIMRAGRFDRKIYITKPNLEEREQLFKFYLSRVKADASIDKNLLARKALWFSPSDIDSMIREAGLLAIRDSRDTIAMKDLTQAYDRVTFGLKSNITLNEKEKAWTAYHEAGHAIVSYLTHPTDDIIKATIVPRKDSLGFIFHTPSEEVYSHNKEHLLANIKVSLAGYVAEKMKFNSTSNGVSSDFKNATAIAYDMVWRHGMGKSGLIGDFHILSQNNNGRLSEKTKEILDNDVQDILQTCIKDVQQILEKNHDLFEFFSQELLRKQELEYDEIEAIFKKFAAQSARPLLASKPVTVFNKQANT